MWYLVDMGNGILYTGESKKEVKNQTGYRFQRGRVILGKRSYEVYDGIENTYVGTLYSSRKQMIADGFGWAFEK